MKDWQIIALIYIGANFSVFALALIYNELKWKIIDWRFSRQNKRFKPVETPEEYPIDRLI